MARWAAHGCQTGPGADRPAWVAAAHSGPPLRLRPMPRQLSPTADPATFVFPEVSSGNQPVITRTPSRDSISLTVWKYTW